MKQKNRFTIYFSLLVFFLGVNTLFSQARLQVIHNAADIAADPVDVYLNGTLLLEDFAFRSATPFIDAPAGVELNVGIALPNTSVDDTLRNFKATLEDGETYVAIANGVTAPDSYASNPDGRSTAFTLWVKPMAREMAMDSSMVEFFAVHGATDAPTVDVIARDVVTLVDDAAYGDITDYLSVPAASYILDVTPGSDNETIVASFDADLSGLTGGSAVVLASGFLDPAQNQDGNSFGLIAVLADGSVVEFPMYEPTARLQVIHNAADVAADPVDVYLNGNLFLEDFAFRSATPFVDAPAGTELNIGIALPNTSVDDTLRNFKATLEDGGTYVAIANGVTAPDSYASNPDGRNTAFTLWVKPMARESAEEAGNIDFFGVHGATDAPTVDLVARNVGTLVNDAAYGDITDYLSVPDGRYILDVTPGNDSSTVVAAFDVDLRGLGGSSAVVLASGFLDPTQNQDGESFGLIAVLVDGTVVEFPMYESTARLQVIHNAADVAANLVDVYLNGNLLLEDFAFRSATPFIDAPAETELNIGIALPNTSVDDTLRNFKATLEDGGTYVAIANGVTAPDSYASNPDGRSTAFTLWVKPMAREMAEDSTSVDFFAVHGATDAPTVDVIARDVATLVDDAAYGDITDYLSVPAAEYTLDVTPGADNNTIVASFNADLTSLAGGSAVILASGFLTPDQNQDGQAFTLIAVLADGTVLDLGGVTSVNDDFSDLIPGEYQLSQNYPNPFNPTTKINFSIPTNGLVTLKIYDILGKEVANLVNENLEAGNYIVNFEAARLSSGVYFYQLKANDFVEVKKMNLIK